VCSRAHAPALSQPLCPAPSHLLSLLCNPPAARRQTRPRNRALSLAPSPLHAHQRSRRRSPAHSPPRPRAPSRLPSRAAVPYLDQLGSPRRSRLSNHPALRARTPAAARQRSPRGRQRANRLANQQASPVGDPPRSQAHRLLRSLLRAPAADRPVSPAARPRRVLPAYQRASPQRSLLVGLLRVHPRNQQASLPVHRRLTSRAGSFTQSPPRRSPPPTRPSPSCRCGRANCSPPSRQ
jgi:hypothetical protein